MFCAHCGKQINDSADFCTFCGKPVGMVSNPEVNKPKAEADNNKPLKRSVRGEKNDEADNSKPLKRSVRGEKNDEADNKPLKRSERKKKKIEPPGIGWRIMFICISAIIFYMALGNLLVGLVGEHAAAYVGSIQFKDKGGEYNLNGNDSLFYLNYEFDTPDGETHSGYTAWRGSEYTPASGYSLYHVGYLKQAPFINRFVKFDSIKYQIRDIKLAKPLGKMDYEISDMKWNLALSIVKDIGGSMVLGVLGYFVLWVAFPDLPFLGLGNNETKRKKKRKKKKR